MLSVILSHSVLMAATVAPMQTVSSAVYATCFSFHMPLFFVLSGYFMHPERRFRWGKELRELVGTYVVTAVIVLAGATVVTKSLHASGRDALRAWASAAVYAAGDVAPHALWPQQVRIGAIWFLIALFWAHLLLYMFVKLPWTPVWVGITFAVGYVSAQWMWLPFDIQSGMCVLAFVYAGHLMRRYDCLGLLKRYPVIWVGAAVIWVADIALFSGFSLALNWYGDYPVLGAVGGVAGTVCMIGISMLVDRLEVCGRAFAHVGRISLALLCAHLIEDDVVPWNMFLTMVHPMIPRIPLWLVLFLVRLPLDFLLAWALSKLPVVNLWFYPIKAKRKEHNNSLTSDVTFSGGVDDGAAEGIRNRASC